MANVAQKFSFFERHENKIDVCFQFEETDFEEFLTWGDALIVEWCYGNELHERIMSMAEYWKQDISIINEDIKNFALHHLQNSKS